MFLLQALRAAAFSSAAQPVFQGSSPNDKRTPWPRGSGGRGSGCRRLQKIYFLWQEKISINSKRIKKKNQVICFILCKIYQNPRKKKQKTHRFSHFTDVRWRLDGFFLINQQQKRLSDNASFSLFFSLRYFIEKNTKLWGKEINVH